MNRREFIRTLVAATTLMAVGATGIFEIAAKVTASQAAARQSAQAAQLTTTAPAPAGAGATPTAPAGYFLLAPVSSLAGKTYAYFTHPTRGNSILVDTGGQWKAFSATCTHRPCTVDFQGSEIYCPCHGATFSAADGSVTRGPATVSLAEYGVQEQGGDVYVSDAVIN